MIKEKYITLGKKPSAIRTLFEYGKERKKEIGDDKVFDFSIGNPNAPAPLCVKEALLDLINNDSSFHLHGYTSSVGDLKVREAVANFLNEKYHANTDSKLVYISCGAAPSLAIIFNCLINEGDEVIAFAPHWPDYKVLVDQAEGTLVQVKPETDHFYPDFSDLESKISEKTRAVIINSPNNPTGTVYNEPTIMRLSKILEEKQKEYGHPIFIVSDEPYRELIYDDFKYPFITNYYDNSIVCYSFSKSLSLPGERIGYIAVSKSCYQAYDLSAAFGGAARALGYACAPSMFQFVIAKCLGETADLSFYKENRDLLYKGLTDIGYEVVYPHGAFYMFMKALEDDDEHFSEVAKEMDLLIVPSKSFGYPGYIRVSYCVDKETIINALPVFKKLYDKYH